MKRNIAISGIVGIAAVAVTGLALMFGGSSVSEQPDTTPAGQVEEQEPVAPSVPTSAEPPVSTSDPAAPQGDTAVVTTPDVPAPPPGVPYDSDGDQVYPNPPNMAPGEVAPLPPAPEPTREPQQTEQPIIPDPPNGVPAS